MNSRTARVQQDRDSLLVLLLACLLDRKIGRNIYGERLELLLQTRTELVSVMPLL